MSGFHAVIGCRKITITDFICVPLKTMKMIRLCFVNMKKDMVLDFGMIFTMNILWDLLIQSSKQMKNLGVKKLLPGCHYQSRMRRMKMSELGKDKCTGCFGAANNDCPECIREKESGEKSNPEWTEMIMRRFMRRE